MSFETITNGRTTFAHIIRNNLTVVSSTFFSEPSAEFQVGLLARKAGFVEAPHRHKVIERRITGVSQFLVLQKGEVALDFFDDTGVLFSSVTLYPGDAAVIIDGTHSLRALSDMQCVSVKQGPFLGAEEDKVDVEVVR